MPVTITKGMRVKSLNFGWMEAVSEPYVLGEGRYALKVDVRFDDTGHIRREVPEKNFLGGYVRDGAVLLEKGIGSKWNTFTDGVAEIVEYVNSRDLLVEFLNTGNRQRVQLDALVRGLVSDNKLTADKMSKEAADLAERKRLREEYSLQLQEVELQRKSEAVARRKHREEAFLLEQARLAEAKADLASKRAGKIHNLEVALTPQVKCDSLEKNTKGVINVDFKDRDGKWVLRFSMNDNFVQTRLGKLHNNMTQRANSEGSYQNEYNKCYEGVGVSEMFKDPQQFCDWAVTQVGWGMGFHLDKDLLGGDQRVYSEDTCVFLPREINLAIARFTNTTVNGGELAFMMGGLEIIVPGFTSKEDALCAYRKYREMYVKKLAQEYREVISIEAYEALMNWTLEVSD